MLAMPALLIGVSAVGYQAWLVPKWEEQAAAVPLEIKEPPGSYRPSGSSFRRDAVELTPEFRAVIDEARRLTDQELEGREEGLGFIHLRHEVLQRILKERYGVSWRTLREMNPEICID